MILIVWVLNFAISWLNAWGCGKSWNETKTAGGLPHLVNWAAAVMSASGFTWCYLVIAGFFGSTVSFEHEVAGKIVNAPLFDHHALAAFADLGYLLVAAPILGSGIVLTLHSWRVAWEERGIASMGVAGWNTFAMAHNVYSVAQHAPAAFDGIKSFIAGGDDDEAKGVMVRLVIAAVVVCAIGGILTTTMIIRSVARRTAGERSFDRQLRT